MNPARLALGGIVAWELVAAARRFGARRRQFAAALARSKATRRPLVVVGDPDTGLVTRFGRANPCGDITIDLTGAPNCSRGVAHNLTKGPTPGIAADSAVVFVSAVVEYTQDAQAAWREILRMAGSTENVFAVAVWPATLTGTVYPGATWWVSGVRGNELVATRIPSWAKVAAYGGLAALTFAARPRLR